jgi:hypothetical protein
VNEKKKEKQQNEKKRKRSEEKRSLEKMSSATEEQLLSVKVAAAMLQADKAKSGSDVSAYHNAVLALHTLVLQLRASKLGFTAAHVAAVRRIERILCARKFVMCVEKAAQFGRRRAAVVKEVLASETSFTAGLVELATVFGKESAPWDAATRRVVFAHVDALAQFHRDRLLPALRDAIAAKSATLLGQSFLLLNDVLDTYTAFVNSYDDAAAALHAAVAANPALGAWLDQTAGNVSPNCGVARLSSLLVTPVQRVPRYCLLLRDLIAFADATGDAAPDLHASLAAVQEIAARINEEKAKHQNQKLVRAVFDQCDAELKQLLAVASVQRQAHKFVEMGLTKPVLCNRCAKMVFGLTRKGLECSACKYRCHGGCASTVPASCAGEGGDVDIIDLVRAPSVLATPAAAAAAGDGVRLARLASPCSYSGSLVKKPLELTAVLFDDELILANLSKDQYICAGVVALGDNVVAELGAARSVTLKVSPDESHTLQFNTAELAKGVSVAINTRDETQTRKKKRVRRKKSIIGHPSE